MNAHLKHVLDRAEHWPEAAKDALVRAALDIENKLVASATNRPKPSLREVMRASPLGDIDLERVRHYPTFRNVEL